MIGDKDKALWVKGESMETQQIINWLRDKACRAPNLSWERMLNMAAKRLAELDKPLETARWTIHITSGNITAECPVCHFEGDPRWKCCPMCETRMVK